MSRQPDFDYKQMHKLENKLKSNSKSIINNGNIILEDDIMIVEDKANINIGLDIIQGGGKMSLKKVLKIRNKNIS